MVALPLSQTLKAKCELHSSPYYDVHLTKNIHTYIHVHTVVCCAYGLLFLLITMYVCTFRIGKATGYKLSELSGLVEGSTLIIGGKQIEVNLFIYCMVQSKCIATTPRTTHFSMSCSGWDSNPRYSANHVICNGIYVYVFDR